MPEGEKEIETFDKDTFKPFKGVHPDQKGVYKSIPRIIAGIGRLIFFASPNKDTVSVNHIVTAELTFHRQLRVEEAEALRTQLLLIAYLGNDRRATSAAIIEGRNPRFVSKMTYEDWVPETMPKVVEQDKEIPENIVQIHPDRRRVSNPLPVKDTELSKITCGVINVVKPF